MTTPVRALSGVYSVDSAAFTQQIDTTGGNFLVIKAAYGGSSGFVMADITVTGETVSLINKNDQYQSHIHSFYVSNPTQGILDVNFPNGTTEPIFWTLEVYSDVDTAAPIGQQAASVTDATSEFYTLSMVSVPTGAVVSALAHWGVSSTTIVENWTAPANATPFTDAATNSTGRIMGATASLDGTYDLVFQHNSPSSSNNRQVRGFVINSSSAALTAPTTITPATATSLTITGVASGTTASSLTLDDGTTTVTQTIDSQSHDGTETLTVNFTPVQGNIPFGTGRTLEATLSDASTVSGTTELVTIAGNAAVDVVDPVTTENSVYHEATSPNADTPETGDQIEHTDSGNTTVAADGTITQTEVRNFEARFWSVTDRTWGSFETISPFDVDAIGGITRRALTRRGLTSRSLTRRSLTS